MSAVCEEMLRRGLRVDWSLPNGVRIDKLDPEMRKELPESIRKLPLKGGIASESLTDSGHPSLHLRTRIQRRAGSDE